MILEARSCTCCQSTNIVKNGKNASGQQRYRCNDCGVTRVLDSVQKVSQVNLSQVQKTYEERNSFRSTGRIFGVSHVTVQRWLKKSSKLSPLQGKCADAPCCALRSSAGSRRSVHLCRAQSQEDPHLDRALQADPANCLLFHWRRFNGVLQEALAWILYVVNLRIQLPYAYLKCKSFSDFWKAYKCLPDSTHQKVGKETRETAHVERLNNTIRQRFSRLVRRTLSYSKREYMLNLHFKLWAYSYNLTLA